MFGGDFRSLKNTVATFHLLAPNDQLVQAQRELFQIVQNEYAGAVVDFKDLQPGVTYTVNYSFPIGSFVQTGSFEARTKSSGENDKPLCIAFSVSCQFMFLCRASSLSW